MNEHVALVEDNDRKIEELREKPVPVMLFPLHTFTAMEYVFSAFVLTYCRHCYEQTKRGSWRSDNANCLVLLNCVCVCVCVCTNTHTHTYMYNLEINKTVIHYCINNINAYT